MSEQYIKLDDVKYLLSNKWNKYISEKGTVEVYEELNNLKTYTIPDEADYEVGDNFYYPYQGFARAGKVKKVILGIIEIADDAKVYKTKEEAEQALKELRKIEFKEGD